MLQRQFLLFDMVHCLHSCLLAYSRLLPRLWSVRCYIDWICYHHHLLMSRVGVSQWLELGIASLSVRAKQNGGISIKILLPIVLIVIKNSTEYLF